MNKAKSKALAMVKRYSMNTVVFYIMLPLSIVKESIQKIELLFVTVAN